ncbi:MAG: MFS transporter [Acidimicrobiales bacterium]
MKAGRPYSRGSLVVVTSTLTICVLPIFLAGALGVQLRHSLHFDIAGLGFAVGTAFLVATATSYGFGHLAERIGAIRQMRLATLAAAVSCVGIAAEAHSLAELIGWLTLGGMANAACQPAANIYLVGTIAENRQGLAFGVKQAAIPASMLLGGMAVPAIALTIGWRWAYAGVALAALMVAGPVLMMAASREPQHSPADSSTVDTATSDTESGDAVPDREKESSLHGARRFPLYLIMLTVAMTLGSISANAFGAFLVSSSVHHGLSAGSAGILLGLGATVGLASRIVSGVLADRREGRHLYTVALMFAGGAAGYLLLATGMPTLMIPAAILAFALGWGWPGLFTFAVVRAHKGKVGQTTGITQTGAYLGGVLGPVYFGLVVSHSSYADAWLANAGIAILGIVAMLAGRALLSHHLQRQPALA